MTASLHLGRITGYYNETPESPAEYCGVNIQSLSLSEDLSGIIVS